MRLLLPCLLSAVLSSGLVPESALAGVADIMPLEQVKPGMKGYGMTVFKGETPERFEFEVIGIIDNWKGLPHVIMVRLSGGPKDEHGREVLEQTRTIAGMSGSPLYINGRLVGALAMAPEFATSSKAFITPIENMFEQRKFLGPAPPPSMAIHPIEAGEYFCTCLIWGDSEDCSSATVTQRDGNLVYATGHENEWLYTLGRVQVPAWHAPVLDVLETQVQSIKITPKLGQMIGTMVYNGRFGSIIRLGQESPSFSVSLSIADVIPNETVRRSYRAAQHFMAGYKLRELIADQLIHLVDPSVDARISAVVRVSGYDQPFRLSDRPGRGLNSLAVLIEKLIREDYPSRTISSVDISVTVPPGVPQEVVKLLIHPNEKTHKAEYVIVAQDSRDRHIVERHTEMEMEVLTGSGGRTLLWLDGATVQEYLLHDISVRAAAPQLFQIADREALYLYDSGATGRQEVAGTDTSQWHELPPEAAVLRKLGVGPVRLFVKDSLGFGVTAEPTGAGTYKIIIQPTNLSEMLK